MVFFTFMKTRLGFRLAWILSLMLPILSGAVDLLLPRVFYTQELRTIELTVPFANLAESLVSLIYIALVIFLGLMLKAWLGVFRMKKKDLQLCVWLFMLSFLAHLLLGDQIFSGLGLALYDFGNVLGGACIAVAFCSSLNEEFS